MLERRSAVDLQVAELFGGDIHQQVLAACVLFGDALGEIAAGGGQFALRSAELFEHEVGEAGIAFADPDGVLQALVVCEHDDSIVWDGVTGNDLGCAS